MSRAFSAAVLTLAFALFGTVASASDVNTWSSTASGNTAPSPNGFPDNMNPSQVHPTVREIMAAVKRWWNYANATTSTGSANSQVLTYSPAVTSCVAGEGYTFFAGYTNTGPTTLTVGGCSAPIKLGANDLTGGELVAGRVVMVFHNGTSFQLITGGGSSTGPGPLPGVSVTLHSGDTVTLHSGVPVTFHGS